ncbi:hypothetical protein QWY92_20355 [Algibacter miyuki]|nr:hypothetical protein [Algibacter miyuki]MDN3667722.1 hypothetical protein [Algibacter miyuki]
MAIQPTEKYMWQGMTDNTEEVLPYRAQHLFRVFLVKTVFL